MSTDQTKPTHKFVVIIGAGISGITAGSEIHRKNVLKDPAEEMAIFDRMSGYGGVWYANTYPGAACDVVSHIYSISWFPKHDWTHRYSQQGEICAYYKHIAHYYNLHKSTVFNTTVLSTIWDDEQLVWNITVRNDTTGTLHYYTSNTVISAIGQLNRPKRAAIPGADTFSGAQFHTAEWDHSADLTGKRVAVIGTGPSAGQVIPSIAEKVKALHVFQRSPPHVFPRGDYTFSTFTKSIFKYVPFAQWLHHTSIYWEQERMPYQSVHTPSKANAIATQVTQAHMESQIPASRQDLRDKLTPQYTFGCKRPLFLDSYYPALLRPNVTLTTAPPLKITPHSIVTAEGEAEIDVIIWATGFLTQDVLGHVDVRGHQGVRLKEQWGDTAQAFLGTSTHNFPNLFFMYGPGTGLLWGSLTFMFETQALWNAKMLRHIYGEQRRGRRTAYAVKGEPERLYNTEIQEKMKRLALTDSGCTSFYKNTRGVVTTNYPWSLTDYWRRTLWIEWDKYQKWEVKL